MLVGLLAQKAEVKYDKERITPNEIVCHLKEMGFGCSPMDKQGQGQNTVEIIVSLQPFCLKYLMYDYCTTIML